MKKFDEACQKLADLLDAKKLAKNEIALSTDSKGLFYLDFGTDVSSELQESAMSWLNQQGYKIEKTDQPASKKVKKRWFV